MSALPLITVESSTSAAVRRLPGILEMPGEELRAWLSEQRQPAMRMTQLRRQILASGATTFEEMTDLPKELRLQLADRFAVFSTRIERHQIAADRTHKLVLRLRDDRLIECVLIQDDDRATACISTQVGCGMGCVFCASGLNGMERNLSSGEILEQLVRLRNLVNTEREGASGYQFRQTQSSIRRLTHIVVMGMGEPLANLDALLHALAVAGDKNGLGIGARHITISTVGLPAKIRRLAELGKQYHLAVSLHAPNDRLRNRIVPTNEKTGIAAILEAANDFFEKTGRQVTYEYVVLGRLNDRPEHARELAGLLGGRKAHLNLIPWNNVSGLPYERPSDQDLMRFIEVLRNAGVSVKVRKRKGSEIDAACGQLRRKIEGEIAAIPTN